MSKSKRNVDPRIAQLRARLAAAKRHHPDANHGHLESELATASLAATIRRVVDAAPRLTEEQRTRLALLLAPVTDGGGRDAA